MTLAVVRRSTNIKQISERFIDDKSSINDFNFDEALFTKDRGLSTDFEFFII
jgi:hypothetical protein